MTNYFKRNVEDWGIASYSSYVVTEHEKLWTQSLTLLKLN